jgi:hypothetical protein
VSRCTLRPEELKQEKKNENDFTLNVQKCHLKAATGGDPQRLEEQRLMFQTNRHGTLAAAGLVSVSTHDWKPGYAEGGQRQAGIA